MGLGVADPAADILGLGTKKAGLVVGFLAEDSPKEVNNRAYHLARRLSEDVRRSAEKNLRIYPMNGEKLDLGRWGSPDLELIADFSQGARLIIIDPLSQFHNLDENSNSEMAILMGNLNCVAKRTGAAVLFIHHVSKGSVRNGQGDQQQAARGASALTDNARWCGYLARMTANEAKRLGVEEARRGRFIRFGVNKLNNDMRQPDLWFERCEGGVLLPAAFAAPEAPKGPKATKPTKPTKPTKAEPANTKEKIAYARIAQRF